MTANYVRNASYFVRNEKVKPAGHREVERVDGNCQDVCAVRPPSPIPMPRVLMVSSCESHPMGKIVQRENNIVDDALPNAWLAILYRWANIPTEVAIQLLSRFWECRNPDKNSLTHLSQILWVSCCNRYKEMSVLRSTLSVNKIGIISLDFVICGGNNDCVSKVDWERAEIRCDTNKLSPKVWVRSGTSNQSLSNLYPNKLTHLLAFFHTEHTKDVRILERFSLSFRRHKSADKTFRW